MTTITPDMFRRAKPTTMSGLHRDSKAGKIRFIVWPAVKFIGVRDPVLLQEEDDSIREFKSQVKALAYAAKELKKRQKEAAMKESMS